MATPELQPSEKLVFLELMGKSCKILIQPDEEATAELKEVKSEFSQKSASSRLRGILFVQWRHLTDTNMCEISFENFYSKEMDKLIMKIKETLPERI